MKRYILSALLCCFSICCFGQGMYGFQAGMGFNTGGYHSKKTPAVEAYYLFKVVPRLYMGGSLYFQRYSLRNDRDAISGITYGDVVSISQKSSYIFVSPKFDLGIGYRQYLHVYATFGVGVFAGGRQFSDTYSPYWTPPGGAPYGADTVSKNTTYNIPNAILRYGVGISERIPTQGYWNIMFSQEFGKMPGGLSNGPYPFNTSYFCFTVGVMHKYPMVFMEY